ncbi:MAG TPA: hypothetical protein VMH61_07880, partial [Candidatus Acidoferrales bacterium]|nr:hypothetical protein [Candidatus Acidoferrales bacterium]
VRALDERAWSLRPLGTHAALLRHRGEPREVLRFAAPAGASGARVRPAARASAPGGAIKLEGRTAEARVDRGDHVIEWTGA